MKQAADKLMGELKGRYTLAHAFCPDDNEPMTFAVREQVFRSIVPNIRMRGWEAITLRLREER